MEKLTYTNVNGYLIPNITYKSGNQMEQLGKYGFLRRDYLKNHRNADKVMAVMPMWSIVLVIAGIFICAIIGGMIGKALLKKHFVKAGIV